MNADKYGKNPTGNIDNINTAHAYCKLSNKGYKDTLKICNTDCFSTETVVTQTLLIKLLV